MIKFENVSKNYDDVTVLKDFNMTVPKASVYGLMGLNGAGKTTVIKHLAGFLKNKQIFRVVLNLLIKCAIIL